MKKIFRFSDSRKVASLTAFSTIVAYGIFLVIINLIYQQPVGIQFLLLGLGIWVAVYFITLFFVDKFIFSKIRVIYKTIHSQKVPKGIDPRQTIEAHSVEDVQREVTEWSDERREEIETLKELEKYRREYIGNISHELKTPIFNIQGYILTLLDGGLEDPNVNRNYLLKAEKSVNRMIAIIEDLEMINLLEANELKLNIIRFNLVDLAREAVESLEMKTKKRECEVFINHNIDRPIYVLADRQRILQVFTNLIDNAIKYGKKSGGRIKISFFDMDENILAEITDDGPGISQNDLTHIFERFYRLDRGRSREMGGTGLGLAIVKHIIEAHHQTVNVRSSIGVGTTFGFTLKKA
ncbi:MAG TPA: ATP-binding protein [Bacteroidales bacterium]|jgi:two-component system phosphate regulon sensor histidine kinase PhoR|nr:sensor histidine kinase [Bacteroidales bacterium]MDI9573898.1 ATP-binding protein [Bacteroidota bacterium]OQC58970.1 MAG: Alkaline phosphatase synthesis sensor protein PhoR [Bacteroidetes bacterium ADurb.Bin012]MBP9511670.1 sensor histidine kinase [Bacteroidales bacterium]MBP9587992.1 sensor histidine kinase [Bacteroidales bacterium]